MVIVEPYALSFWRNGHEERGQCETAHYRDAKTTSCLPKISFETVLSDPLDKQNLMALLCSTNSDIVKIEKITFSRLENASVTML